MKQIRIRRTCHWRIVACCLIVSFLLLGTSLSAQEGNRTAQNLNHVFGFQLDVPLDNLPGDLDEAARLGAAWVRLTGQTGLDWQQVEPSPGFYDWTSVDRRVKAAHDRGLNVFMTVRAVNRAYGARPGRLPRKLGAFTNFLAKAVERYDGDGVNDASGSPLVRVWQIETELDYPGNWTGSAGDYAALLEASHKAVKDANPRAKVAMAGMMGPGGLDLYGKIMKRLGRDASFDVFDLHWNNTGGGNYRLQRWWHVGHVKFDAYFNRAQDLLDPQRDRAVETWITEATASDTANQGDDQRTQAAELVYRHVYAIRKGASAVFWVHVRDDKGSREPRDYFNHAALIDSAGRKKLSYYTYQQMTDKLAGCNRNNLQVTAEDVNLCVYKFARRGQRTPRDVWVLWNDGLGARTYSLKLGSTAPVRITQAIPRVGLRLGSEIRDPAHAFTVTRRQSASGTLQVELQPGVPIYVELGN